MQKRARATVGAEQVCSLIKSVAKLGELAPEFLKVINKSQAQGIGFALVLVGFVLIFAAFYLPGAST